MNEQHTPGPWHIDYVIDGGFLISATTDGDPMKIAFREGIAARHVEFVANARLIAAAPDLLQAVKEYLEWGPMTGSDRDLFDAKFTAAIAKAEGER